MFSILCIILFLTKQPMVFKTEQFFKGTDLDVKSTVQMLMQYPNQTEEIVNFVACKIKHFAEFNVKMDILKKEYDQNVMELYAHYMNNDIDEEQK